MVSNIKIYTFPRTLSGAWMQVICIPDQHIWDFLAMEASLTEVIPRHQSCLKQPDDEMQMFAESFRFLPRSYNGVIVFNISIMYACM